MSFFSIIKFYFNSIIIFALEYYADFSPVTRCCQRMNTAIGYRVPPNSDEIGDAFFLFQTLERRPQVIRDTYFKDPPNSETNQCI